MLLQQLISSQQQAYATIQDQIEQLQEQQRQIQAHLQQLGSVESQMVSAVQMLAEAISSISQHCPGELENYKNLVTGLFGSAPVAQIEAGAEAEKPEEIADVEVTEVVEVVEIEEVPTCELELLTQIKDTILCFSYQEMKEVLSTYKLNTKGKALHLKERFIEYCEPLTLVQQQAILELLKKVAPSESNESAA